MRFVWIGVRAEGLPAFEGLLEAGAPIVAALTLEPRIAAARRSAVDYRPLCDRFGIPLHHLSDLHEPRSLRLLTELQIDIGFVIGWHQRVRSPALATARIGMIGAHASLLPHNRGPAPINWALIRGESSTGATLFWLGDSVREAAIVDQTVLPITVYDTCATLYDRVARATREMLLRLLPRLLAGDRPGRPAPPSDEPMLRRRRAVDGWMDWTESSGAIYDLVRALTRPYPGAFTHLDGKRWRIWQAALPSLPGIEASPGEVLGPVRSPIGLACGQLVACGSGAITLLELEDDDGIVLRGPDLSEQPWLGKRWGALEP